MKTVKSILSAMMYFITYITIFALVSLTDAMILTGYAVFAEMPEEQAEKFTFDTLNRHGYAITMIAAALMIFVVWLIFRIRKKKMREEIGLYPIAFKTGIQIVFVTFGVRIVTLLFLNLTPFPESWVLSYKSAIDRRLADYKTSTLGLFALESAVCAPVIEEFVFRGLVYTRLKRGMPTVLAAVLSSLLFGAAHGNIIQAIYCFAGGMVDVWLYEKYKSLSACMLEHSVFNVVYVLRTIILN